MMDTVIVGAGPYGLACAAHLRAAGVETRVLGDPMGYWRDRMPAGMCLRSSWRASTISDPANEHTLDAYEQELGTPLPRPLPRADFLRYGDWFRRRAVPDVEPYRVAAIDRTSDGFRLELEEGATIRTRRVVVATGLEPFERRPPEFDDVPEPLATHAANVSRPADYAGQRVLVVGGGQSAVELSALLAEGGATVELVARAEEIRWLHRSARLHHLGPLTRALYAPTDVGPAVLSWLAAAPRVFRKLPLSAQERLSSRAIRPAASSWLMDRTREVTKTFERSVRSARVDGSSVAVTLDDGSSRRVDRIVLATGYHVDIARLPFLTPGLRDQLHTRDGSPLLGPGLESSVPGLHFAGAFAAASCGPVMRFVSGTWSAAPALATVARGNRLLLPRRAPAMAYAAAPEEP